jgi:hypothetical protein
MELEYVNRWVGFDPSGYGDLIAAVEAGPLLVGEPSTDPTSSASTGASTA